ncbi:hypothetical protein DRF75_04015 [Ehrlichia minasensis]|uniref:Uncharacterized protein n=1 Tax=Ehrlichia minasensis TaxID=1242993 RepID=A0A4Q6I785_9RICK|nr:hypothetical protein [Ehrlichia minasensis]RZB12459.1 hypothetical protein DRF75_04015 [Ehrlichia minasensis]
MGFYLSTKGKVNLTIACCIIFLPLVLIFLLLIALCNKLSDYQVSCSVDKLADEYSENQVRKYGISLDKSSVIKLSYLANKTKDTLDEMNEILAIIDRLPDIEKIRIVLMIRMIFRHCQV